VLVRGFQRCIAASAAQPPLEAPHTWTLSLGLQPCNKYGILTLSGLPVSAIVAVSRSPLKENTVLGGVTASARRSLATGWLQRPDGVTRGRFDAHVDRCGDCRPDFGRPRCGASLKPPSARVRANFDGRIGQRRSPVI
jgi:hypothetical protein